MNPPILSILVITLISFVGSLFVESAAASDNGKVDYKPLFQKANRSAALWKKEAQHLEDENWQLRELLEATVRATQKLAPQPAQEAAFEEFYIEIPDNGASNIAHHGGPDIKVNVWWKLPGGAILQVGTSSLHKVYVPLSGRKLIYRDTLSGDEVYLTDGIVPCDKLQLLVRRFKG